MVAATFGRHMKIKLLLFYTLCILLSCKQNNEPDVDGINVNITIERFDKAFFAIDTNNILNGIQQLNKQYPYFTNDFTENILGAGQVADTNKTLLQAGRQFLTSYQPVHKLLNEKFNGIAWLQKDITKAFKHVKFYFPKYPVPKVVTFLGPFDAPGVAITNNALAIGLQLYAGADFAFYNTPEGQQLYPSYISKRFSKEYIVPNCMKAIAEDLFADKSGDKPLVEQMISKGKYWYLAKQFLPATHDSLITGFTKKQLEWSDNNEGVIWNYFLQSNHLYTTEPGIIQLYIGEAPGTQVFPEAAPGNIGAWVGLQIIKSFVSNTKNITPEELMRTDAKVILQNAKYKPR
jgi:hypothetical protein